MTGDWLPSATCRIADAFRYVSTEADARLAQLEELFAVLQEERWFEGAVRILERQFQNRPEWAEDAVATAFERWHAT